MCHKERGKESKGKAHRDQGVTCGRILCAQFAGPRLMTARLWVARAKLCGSWCAPRRWASAGAESSAVGVDFKTTVAAGVGGHRVCADMPPPDGLGDGPSPKDLVMAGLAACTSMAIQARANRMLEAGRLEAGAFRGVQVAAHDDTAPGKHMPEGVRVHIAIQGVCVLQRGRDGRLAGRHKHADSDPRQVS